MNILYRVYVSILEGKIAHGTFTFITKEGSLHGPTSSSTGKLRPLSLSNTSQKMVASAIAYSLSKNVGHCISKYQFGGVRQVDILLIACSDLQMQLGEPRVVLEMHCGFSWTSQTRSRP